MTITIPTIKVSPTTLNGYLTGIMVLCGVLADANSLPQGVRTVAATVGSLALALRIRIGHIQQDPGTQLAQVPGQLSPEVVPSHEIPNDPKAVAITDAAIFPGTTTKP